MNFKRDHGADFGPFWCRVDVSSGYPIRVPDDDRAGQSVTFSAGDYLLFIQTVPLDHPGRASIKLYSWIMPDRQSPATATPLPQLIPSQPDPGVRLTLAGNALLVDGSESVSNFCPNESFLTRWWVNDRPFVPDPNAVDPLEPMVEDISGSTWYVKKVRFDLDFRPARLRAHKGDKIGVQLLFRPYGCHTCADQSNSTFFVAQLQPHDRPATAASLSFPSNRIDFIYSGDPGNIQQK
jgi:hypothetical protein